MREGAIDGAKDRALLGAGVGNCCLKAAARDTPETSANAGRDASAFSESRLPDCEGPKTLSMKRRNNVRRSFEPDPCSPGPGADCDFSMFPKLFGAVCATFTCCLFLLIASFDQERSLPWKRVRNIAFRPSGLFCKHQHSSQRKKNGRASKHNESGMQEIQTLYADASSEIFGRLCVAPHAR